MAMYWVGYMSQGRFNTISHTMSTLTGARSFAYEHIGWTYSELDIAGIDYGDKSYGDKIVGQVCMYRIKSGPRKGDVIRLWWDKQKNTYQIVYANGRLGDYVKNVVR